MSALAYFVFGWVTTVDGFLAARFLHKIQTTRPSSMAHGPIQRRSGSGGDENDERINRRLDRVLNVLATHLP